MTLKTSERCETRRRHQKSKNGCLVCKKRRVKCDESRPRCRNCAKGERDCRYLEPKGIELSSFQSEEAGSGSVVLPPDNLKAPDGAHFSTIHMVLLHHAETNMAQIMAIQGDMRPVLDTAINSAFTAPYLLDQLLALSALHFSSLDPRTASLYHSQATELQTRALGAYNRVNENITESNCVPAFLFATFLGFHVLQDTLANAGHAYSKFVSGFVSYARLHRGVRAVTSSSWTSIIRSDLKPLMYTTEWIEGSKSLARGPETGAARRMLECSSDAESPCVKACLSALDWIQRLLDIMAQAPSRFDLGVHLTMAWPLLVPDEYLQCLYQHRPEALVVVAYYLAILQRLRKFWVFGDAGSVFIPLISEHSGPFWADALSWPLRVLDE